MRERTYCRWLFMAFLFLAACPDAARAEDVAEAVRRELDAVREQFETMRQQYEQRLQELGERLQKMEAERAAPAPPAPPPPAAAAPEAAPPAPPSPGLADLLRPRQPFALYQNPRPLLFDIGVSGDFVADFTSSRVGREDLGTFAGRENRLFPREVSLGVFGRIDPYASAAFRITAEEEPPEDGAEAEVVVILEEANVTLLTLPFNTQARFGVMRPRFGTLNSVHGDDLPQVDRPNVLSRFFGEEQLVGEKGVDVVWILPTSIYNELSVGVFDGDNETAFGYRSLRDPLVLARLRTFFELDEWGGLQVDLSGGTGVSEDDRRNTVAGLGAKYKWRPLSGIGFPILTLAGEGIYGNRAVFDEERAAEGGKLVERFESWGYYVYGQYDWTRRWAAGVRYDWTELPTEEGDEWAISPYLQLKPSEFLRFRVQYKHTEGSRQALDEADELFIQGTFILGAHPTERF